MARMNKSLKERLQTAGLKKAIGYMDKNPDENIPKIIHWLEKSSMVQGQTAAVKSAISDKDGEIGRASCRERV